jgi:hypothetical protein
VRGEILHEISSHCLYEYSSLEIIIKVYQPRMIDDEHGAVGGMRIDRGNRSTRRKPVPLPLCPPQIPYELIWDRIRAAAVGSLRLTA